MKTVTKAPVFALIVLLGLACRPAAAATVTFGGSQINSVGDGWRTTTVAKTEDANFDNIYGTDGFVMFQVTTNGPDHDEFTHDAFSRSVVSLPGYISAVNSYPGAQPPFPLSQGNGDGGYNPIDDPAATPGAGPITNRISGIAGVESGVDVWNGTEEFELFSFTVASGAPQGFRMGILTDNTAGLAHNLADVLRVTVGASSASTGALTFNNQNDFYFFDIVNAVPGDVIHILGSTQAAGAFAGRAAIGGVTFDTPEPTTLCALSLGGLIMLRRRR